MTLPDFLEDLIDNISDKLTPNNFDKNTFYTGILSIMITVFILTIFEIGMFYKIITQNVKDSVDNSLDNISKKLSDSINNQTSDPNSAFAISSIFNEPKTEAFLYTNMKREKDLTNQINNYTLITAVSICLIVGIIIVLIRQTIKKNNNLEYNDKPNKARLLIDKSFKTANYNAGVTVLLVISFQIYFYFFGQKYLYPGAMGDEELMMNIYSYIDA